LVFAGSDGGRSDGEGDGNSSVSHIDGDGDGDGYKALDLMLAQLLASMLLGVLWLLLMMMMLDNVVVVVSNFCRWS